MLLVLPLTEEVLIMVRKSIAFCVVLGLVAAGATSARTDDKKTTKMPVKLKVTKLENVMKDIKAQKGKVVVLDVWATFCIPCMKEFPHLVELSEKFPRSKVTCMSVSVDFTPKEDAPKALMFLKKVKAHFPNYLLTDDLSVWQKHWDLNGPPGVFVYDQNGKLFKAFKINPKAKRQFNYTDVERVVRKLLKAKKK